MGMIGNYISLLPLTKEDLLEKYNFSEMLEDDENKI